MKYIILSWILPKYGNICWNHKISHFYYFKKRTTIVRTTMAGPQVVRTTVVSPDHYCPDHNGRTTVCPDHSCPLPILIPCHPTFLPHATIPVSTCWAADAVTTSATNSVMKAACWRSMLNCWNSTVFFPLTHCTEWNLSNRLYFPY